MQDLNKMKTGQLIAIYNERAADDTLVTWKSSKAKLISKIEALPTKTTAAVSDEDTDYEAAITATAISSRDSIALASYKLLETVAYEHDGRDWGLPYDIILAEVKRVFPDCSTTIACLRWYAVRLNEGGVILPKRQRSKSK